MLQKILTGIKPTGQIHIGNYVGAIKPSLDLAQKDNISSYLFIADSHSLTIQPPTAELKHSIHQAASAWLACGLDPNKVFFYCQSDIPELFELNWILSCCTPKGLMNRAHSYKAKRDQNLKLGKKDLDDKVNMGLYNYPILMSADILLFSPHQVPVGGDQVQHLEMARDIAQKFNHIYKSNLFTIPKALVREQKILPGLDGRKMSKSYNNEIPLFLESKKLQKLIRKIKTDSLPAETPKDTKNCLIFQIYKHFASAKETQNLKEHYAKGIGWGEAKDILFYKLEDYFKKKKETYDHYMSQPLELEKILKTGSEKVKEEAQAFLKQVKKTVGLFKEL
ncbi:MAG: tryptophan--tRNA ligase [Oligoflexia bacterium]|nr:tryptophan--tRNA ligase [Oligoflexia bacterium]